MSEEMESSVTLDSSDPKLRDAFTWAKHQALQYVFNHDPVGPWYEAALPGRAAFCMRDVSHQTTGAQILGLARHNKNMLKRFAENISASKDWCSYWEITKDNQPAPDDYTSDQDFWYNLPANFDVIDCCFRQYLWTGDPQYIREPVFWHFYEKTVHDYVQKWDINGDGLLEHLPSYGRRGIATYNEQIKDPLLGGDMIAAQFAGYMSYAAMLALRGQVELAEQFRDKAVSLQKHYSTVWWNEQQDRFYAFQLQNGDFETDYAAESSFLPLYFGLIDNSAQKEAMLLQLIRNGEMNIEARTYMLDILYQYRESQAAYDLLLYLSDLHTPRREYPEVSFTVVGACATGMNGIRPDARHRRIETVSQLPAGVQWTHMQSIPVFDNHISVYQEGHHATRFTNQMGDAIEWQACFDTPVEHLLVDGRITPAEKRVNARGKVESYVLVNVDRKQTSTVELP